MKARKRYISTLLFMSSLSTSEALAGLTEVQYGPIHFKSSKVAQWRLQSQYRPLSVTEAHRYDSTFTYTAGSQSSVSASRQFNTQLPQTVYATFKVNNTAFQHYAEWLYIPNDIGTFTQLGWLLGHNEGLNMAIELEHRQIGDEENMALSLGVQYLF